MPTLKDQRSLKISVVTVCKNANEHIENCIKSVSQQTYDNLEYIVVDGGSNDGTLETLDRLADATDKVIREEDDGIYDAMNKSLDYVTGDYVVFLNADDEFLDDTVVGKVARILIREQPQILYGKVRLIDEFGNSQPSSDRCVHPNLVKGIGIPHQSVFMSVSLMRDMGGFNLKYGVSADFELFFRSFILNCSFLYSGVYVARYSTNGLSTKKWLEGDLERLEVLFNYGVASVDDVRNKLNEYTSRFGIDRTIEALEGLFKHSDFYLRCKQTILGIENYRGAFISKVKDDDNQYDRLLQSAFWLCGIDIIRGYGTLNEQPELDFIVFEWPEAYMFGGDVGNNANQKPDMVVREALEYYSQRATIMSVVHNNPLEYGELPNGPAVVDLSLFVYEHSDYRIHLGEYTTSILRDLLPPNRGSDILVEHPLYPISLFNQDGSFAEEKRSNEVVRLLVLGALRSLDDIAMICDALSQVSIPNIILVFQASEGSGELVDYIRSKKDRRIKLDIGKKSYSELVREVRRADLGIVVRKTRWNSGVVHQFLSLGVEVAVYNSGNAGLLATEYGFQTFEDSDELATIIGDMCSDNRGENRAISKYLEYFNSHSINAIASQLQRNVFIDNNKGINTQKYKLDPLIYSDKLSDYAPIIVFVYNRVDTLSKTLASLLRNKEAKHTVLYVFSDGWKANSQLDMKRVQRVRDYIDTIEGFLEVVHVRRDTNLGLANSVRSGIDYVSKISDKFIVLEDDLIVSPFFLKFMNEALGLYKDDDDVWCINGMSIIQKKGNEKYPCVKEDAYFALRNSSHGWGSWSSVWRSIDFDISNHEDILRNALACMRIDRVGSDLRQMLISSISSKIDSWSIFFTVEMAVRRKLAVCPVRSLVSAQVSNLGTHINKYIPQIDHDLSLSLEHHTFPVCKVINHKIALDFSTQFNGRVPFLLDYKAYDNSIYSRRSSCTVVKHFITEESGGAGAAALRLSNAINRTEGYVSELITLDRICLEFPEYGDFADWNKKIKALEAKQRKKGEALFSYPELGLNKAILDYYCQDADVIHIHWIRGFLSLANIAYLTSLQIKVVITVHDLNIFTGGCHCPAGCEKWKYDCSNCPQIPARFESIPQATREWRNSFPLPSHVGVVLLNDDYFRRAELHEYTSFAKLYKVFNCVDECYFDRFLWHSNVEHPTKQSGDVNRNIKVLYVGNYVARIKGFELLCDAIEYLCKQGKNIELHVAGVVNDSVLNALTCSVVQHGKLRQDELIVLYSSVDFTVIPSIEDNLPNVALESLSLGTPVVGFAIGGMKDLIKNGANGFLSAEVTTNGLVDALSKAFQFSYDRESITISAYNLFHPQNIAANITEVYNSLSFPEESYSARFTGDEMIAEDLALFERTLVFFRSDTYPVLYSLHSNLSNEKQTLTTVLNKKSVTAHQGGKQISSHKVSTKSHYLPSRAQLKMIVRDPRRFKRKFTDLLLEVKRKLKIRTRVRKIFKGTIDSRQVVKETPSRSFDVRTDEDHCRGSIQVDVNSDLEIFLENSLVVTDYELIGCHNSEYAVLLEYFVTLGEIKISSIGRDPFVEKDIVQCFKNIPVRTKFYIDSVRVTENPDHLGHVLSDILDYNDDKEIECNVLFIDLSLISDNEIFELLSLIDYSKQVFLCADRSRSDSKRNVVAMIVNRGFLLFWSSPDRNRFSFVNSSVLEIR